MAEKIYVLTKNVFFDIFTFASTKFLLDKIINGHIYAGHIVNPPNIMDIVNFAAADATIGIFAPSVMRRIGMDENLGFYGGHIMKDIYKFVLLSSVVSSLSYIEGHGRIIDNLISIGGSVVGSDILITKYFDNNIN